MFKRIITMAGLLLAALPLAACATNASSTGAGANPTPSSTSRVISLGATPVAPGAAGDAFVGTWGGPDAPIVEFRADGTVRVDDGCNPYEGTYVISDGVVTVTPGMATQRECTNRVKWLSDFRTATVEGLDLVLNAKSGSELGTLSQAK